MPLDDNYHNHIPAAVRRASERADEIARTMGVANLPEEDAAPAPTEDPPAPTEDPAASTTVVDAPADPAPAPAPPPPAETDWEQRYRTIQGKYDSEIGQLRGQVASLERLLANLKDTPPAAPVPAADPSPVPIPKEDVETFGDDLITAARRWAAAELSPRIASLEAKIERLTSGQTTIQQETAQQRVMSALDADRDLGGKWRELNESSEFIDWLNQVDPFSGQQRMRLLSDAYGRGDAIRTANFFKAYLAEHTAVSPPPAPAHTSEPEADRLSLESLAAPGRATGPAPSGAPAEKRTWTNTQIAAFYRDVQRGVYNGREADKLRTEQDIFDAASEGRIRS